MCNRQSSTRSTMCSDEKCCTSACIKFDEEAHAVGGAELLKDLAEQEVRPANHHAVLDAHAAKHVDL